MSNEVKVKITGDSASLQTALTDAGKHIGGLGKKAKEAEAPIASLANGLKTAFVGSSVAVGLISLKNSIAHVTGELVQAQIQVDKLRNGLNFAVGRDKAAADMAFIRQSAQAMGLSFVGAAEQYMRLAAASRGTTLEGQKTRDIFTAVAQASTVMGLSAEETEGAFRAIGQMISKNTIMSEELKGQLGERLPGAFQVAARSMGVTTGELNKMLETGQVLAEDFLPKFARQLSGEVAPEVDTASQSMQASINRMTTAWQVFKQTVAQSGASKVIANEATGLSNYMDSLSEAMDRAKRSGSGMTGELLAGLGHVIARAPFDVLAGSANLLNGTLNTLTLGSLGLRTDINLLPAAFETSAQKAGALTGRLAEAESDLAKLQSKLALVPDNIYLKSETYQAFLLVQQLRAAKEAQDKLKGGTPEGNTMQGVRLSGQAREAWDKQHAADLLSLAGIRNKANGVPDGYAKNMAEIIRLNQAGVLVGKEYTTVLAQQQALLTKKAGGGGGVSELSKALGIYNDLTARATGLNSDFSEKWAGLSLAYRAGKISVDQLTDAQARLLTEQTFAKDAAKEQEDRVKEITKAYEAEEAARAKYSEGVSADLAKMVEQTQAQQDLNDRLGLGKEAIAALDAASLELQATKLDGLAIDRLVQYQDTINFASLKAQAEELRKQAALKQQGAAKEAQIDAAKEISDANKKAAEESERFWTDALMDGFNAGKGFFDNMWDSIKNKLKTDVLKVFVQPIAGALSFSGAASAGQGASGGMDALGALGAAKNAVGGVGWLTNFGGSVANAASSLGAHIGGDLGAKMMMNSEVIGATAKTFGDVLGYANAAYALSQGKYAEAAGSAIGTYFGGPIGSFIGSKIGQAVDNFFGGETRSGATYDTGADGRAHYQQGPSGGEIAGADARRLFESAQASITGILSAFGSKSVLTGFTAGLESSDNGKGFNFAGGFIDGKGFGEYGGRTGGQFSMRSQDSKAAFERYTLELGQSIIEALQASDLPQYLAKVFDGITASTATQEQINNTLAYAQGLKNVRDAMTETREPMQILQDAVTAGFADLATSADTFKADFVAAIDAGVSPENLAAWSALNGQMDALAVSAKEAADQLARTAQQLGGALDQIGKSVADMRKRALDAATGVATAQGNISAAYLAAQGGVASAQQTLNDLMRQSADNMLAFGRSIGDFLATISPTTGAGASLSSLKAMLSSTAVLARGGDVDAQGRLIAQAQSVLQAAESSSRSRVEYARSEAFVRSLLADVQASVVPAGEALGGSATLAQQITQATGALTAAQATAARHAELAALTGSSILASTDVVGDEIAKLRTAYDAAAAEQASANLKLSVALAALDALSLSEDALNLITSGQTGAAPGDFATALNVSDEAIAALQSAMGLSDAELAALSDAMNVHVADDVYSALGSALGAPSELFASLGASLGAPADLIASLSQSLGLSPVQMLALQGALGLTADTALMLGTVLGVDPVAQAQWASALGVDAGTLESLGTVLGWDAQQLTPLARAIGLAEVAVETIHTLSGALGFSPAAADTINALSGQVGFSGAAMDVLAALPTQVGFSGAALDVAGALASQVGFSGAALDVANALGSQVGFSGAALDVANALASQVGFSGASLGVISALGTSVGLMGGILDALSGAVGLSPEARQALASMTIGLAGQGADPITNAYQTLFGRTPEASGHAYWQSTGLAGIDLFEAIRANAIGTDVQAKQLRGFAVGTSFVPHDMTARVHAGEEITPRPYVDQQRAERTESNALLAKLVSQVATLTAEVAALRKPAEATALSSKKTSDMLVRVTRDGNALVTTPA